MAPMSKAKMLLISAVRALREINKEFLQADTPAAELVAANVACNLTNSLLDLYTERIDGAEFAKSCEDILAGSRNALRGASGGGSIEIIQFFKKFRPVRGDEELDHEYAERLIRMSGSVEEAKRCIEWFFICPLDEIPNKRRPWQIYEIIGDFSSYLKGNDPRERKRQQLIKQHLEKGR
jgi:hypothetical protein